LGVYGPYIKKVVGVFVRFHYAASVASLDKIPVSDVMPFNIAGSGRTGCGATV
jgi:hypothetical protein